MSNTSFRTTLTIGNAVYKFDGFPFKDPKVGVKQKQHKDFLFFEKEISASIYLRKKDKNVYGLDLYQKLLDYYDTQEKCGWIYVNIKWFCPHESNGKIKKYYDFYNGKFSLLTSTKWDFANCTVEIKLKEDSFWNCLNESKDEKVFIAKLNTHTVCIPDVEGEIEEVCCKMPFKRKDFNKNKYDFSHDHNMDDVLEQISFNKEFPPKIGCDDLFENKDDDGDPLDKIECATSYYIEGDEVLDGDGSGGFTADEQDSAETADDLPHDLKDRVEYGYCIRNWWKKESYHEEFTYRPPFSQYIWECTPLPEDGFSGNPFVAIVQVIAFLALLPIFLICMIFKLIEYFIDFVRVIVFYYCWHREVFTVNLTATQIAANSDPTAHPPAGVGWNYYTETAHNTHLWLRCPNQDEKIKAINEGRFLSEVLAHFFEYHPCHRNRDIYDLENPLENTFDDPHARYWDHFVSVFFNSTSENIVNPSAPTPIKTALDTQLQNSDLNATDFPTGPYFKAAEYYKNITVHHKADVKFRVDSPEDITEPKGLFFTFKHILDIIKMFNCYIWLEEIDYTDAGGNNLTARVLRIEHISWKYHIINNRNNDFDFTPSELKVIKSTPVGMESIRDRIPFKEEFAYMDEDVTSYFVGEPIYYPSSCADSETTKKTSIENFTNDVFAVLQNSDYVSPITSQQLYPDGYDIDDLGYVLVSNQVINGLCSLYDLNKPLSWTELHDCLFKYNRFLGTGNMNETDTTFVYTKNVLKSTSYKINFDCARQMEINGVINVHHPMATYLGSDNEEKKGAGEFIEHNLEISNAHCQQSFKIQWNCPDIKSLNENDEIPEIPEEEED